uniref:C2H2-type domain-containing protein n=1 Tax=viral metagenome TaxID=1070528 RepID=A0A6C0EFD5_9ZZZZ
MSSLHDHICSICNINYASRQSLCNHSRKFHRNNIPNNIEIAQNCSLNAQNIQSKFNCKYCNKIFTKKYNLFRHYITCKNKINYDKKIEEENIQLKKENQKLQKITNNNITNNNINNNDNRKIINNNNININFLIKKIGTENLEDLTEEEIKQILLKNGEGITKFIELLNFNKELPQNHTFCTTNLKSKYLDVYNTDTNTIEKDRKKYFFDHLLKNAVDGIKKLIDLHKKENFIVENNNLITEMLKSSIEFGSKFLNDKILKELFNKIELISYNKKKIVKDTWDGKTNSNNCYIRRIKKLINKINKDRIKN